MSDPTPDDAPGLPRAVALLAEAQRDARIGSWEWDASGAAVWSDERYRLLGLSPQAEPGSLELFLSHVHPEDRQRVLDTVERAQQEGTPFEMRHRIVRAGDGAVRWIHARGRVVRESPLAWFGTDQDVTELVAAEEALRRSETRFRTLFERNLAGVYRSTLDGRLVECNETFARMFGYTVDEMLALPAVTLYVQATDRPAFLDRLRRERTLLGAESQCRRRDGRPIWILENVALVEDEGGPYVEGTALDITDRKGLEGQLRQAVKMEAVGRLAGGIAHDFNNLLTVISGFSELLLSDARLDPGLRTTVEAVHSAAHRAASVTSQLLAFSRKQVLVARILDLGEVVGSVERLLRRMIGEDIQLTCRRPDSLWPVKADPSQLEQVLVNLAVNARDAMPHGGALTIETSNVVLDPAFVNTHPGSREGPHVRLAVTDTGVGMDAETQAHVFEPFFTTKEPGKGTGLGLATVYGIVKQSDGFVCVDSAPQAGATFQVYLPRHHAPAAPDVRPAPLIEAGPRGHETVLLVEDDDMLRGLAREILRASGYVVMEARHPGEALVMAERNPALQLLLTDVVMPHMSGVELAGRVRALIPRLRVLFMSGYTDDAMLRHGVAEDGTPFLQKPFSPTVLTRKVREVLDASG